MTPVIKPGHLVQPLAGGPLMTVQDVFTDEDGEVCVRVIYFHEGQSFTGHTFLASALTIPEPSPF